MNFVPQPGSAEGDEQIIEAIRHEFLRPPSPEVERRHLEDLQAALADPESEVRTTRLRPVLAAAAGLAIVASASWLIVDQGSGSRVQTADDPNPAVVAADPTTTATTPTTAAAAGSVEGADRSTTEPTETVVDPAQDASDEVSSTTSPTSVVDTDDPGSASSGPTSSGSLPSGPPSTSISSPTTANATTSSSTGQPNPTVTTRPTTTTTTAPRVSSTTVNGPSTQQRLEAAWLSMNQCLLPRGHLFVGFPGVSDHPDTSLPGYQTAVAECDRTSGVGTVMDDIEAWGATLNSAERDAHNTAARGVANCMVARSWDLAVGPTPDGVLTITRFPGVPIDRWSFLILDMAECGWFDLDLP